MNLIIDLILLAILIASVIEGFRKGFIRSVMNIITFFAALICGWQFYPILGEFYKESIFMNKISNQISETISSLIGDKIDSLFNEIPPALTDLISRFNIDTGSLEKFYNDQTTASITELTENVSSYIADPFATGISNILAFITIFFAITILLKIVTVILDLIFKLPVLNTLNRVCGIIFGIINGVLYVAVLAYVLLLLSPILSALIPEVYSQNMIESSVFITVVDKLNIASK